MTDVAVAYQTVGRLGIIYDDRIIYDHRIDANADASRFSTAIAPNFVSALAMQIAIPRVEPAARPPCAGRDNERKNDASAAHRSRTRKHMKPLFAILLSLAPLFSSPAAAQSSPAGAISEFRQKHGQGRVVMDATLNRIALEQAKAMAAGDRLDHEVLGAFGGRIAPSRAGRAAENIAFGYDSFEKTLDQWIASGEHRKNLLLPNASRVGVASARSATSHRTYWAMEIAGDYEPPRVAAGKRTPPAVEKQVAAAKRKTPAQPCRLKLLGLCL